MNRQVLTLLISNVHLVWYTLAAASWLVKLFPQLDFVSKHGKLSNEIGRFKSGQNKHSIKSAPSSQPFPSSMKGLLAALTVPKRWFAHLYITGILTTLCALWQRHNSAPEIETFCLGLFLFLLHCTRRLLECWYISSFGQSRMHVSGYLVGLLHYLLVPISFFSSATDRPRATESLHLQQATQTTMVLAFLTANYLQHKYHRLLSSSKFIRGVKQYVFPRGGLFNYVCCPHYLYEMCIYVCFSLLVTQKSTFALLVWVVSNLSVVAQVNLMWYKEHFPAEVGRLQRWKCCIPFVY